MAEKGYECTLKFGGNTIGFARSVDPTFSGAEQDITSRSTAPWRARQGGLLELSFTTEMLYVPDDTSFQAIETAFRARSELSFEITDDDGYGWNGNCILTEFHPGPQDLDNAVMCTITAVSTGTVSQLTPSS